IASFGDLLRVPGSHSTLLAEKSKGGDIRICYSSLDALELARKNPSKKIVFLGIGFETTAPTVAAAIKRAEAEGLKNFLVLSAFKTMPEAMKALLQSGELALNAFICPGHVSVVTGLRIYDFIARDFKTPCVVTGFEPLDLLQAILMIVRQLKDGRSTVENQYTRAALPLGNPAAQALLNEIFAPSDVEWRGLGVIPGSGLGISDAYQAFDAQKVIPLQLEPAREQPGCICGSIMRGVKVPTECKLFAKACNPENPKGSCMVSDEGNCATYYKYARNSRTTVIENEAGTS
ncbi:MAG: hydrogenase formation protein HypD, partial [Bdellovibrionales bacterium GWC1_52_8]